MSLIVKIDKENGVDIAPWFKDTSLCVNNDYTFTFSNDKVNLIITKNGKGKSTLISMIAKYFNCYLFGYPRFSRSPFNYLNTPGRFNDAVLTKTYPDKYLLVIENISDE